MNDTAKTNLVLLVLGFVSLGFGAGWLISLGVACFTMFLRPDAPSKK
jgi:hypothetical protein